jgi:hypothetical protein
MQIDYKDWIEITNKIFDQEVVKAEAVFVHGWGDLHEKMIEFTAEVYKNSGAKYLVINGEKEYEVGAPGVDFWTQRLVELGVPKESTFSFVPMRQTREEAIAFTNFAKEKNIKKAILISTPVHIVRALLTNIALMTAASIDLNLYPVTIKNVNWEEKIVIRGLVGTYPDENTSRIGRFAGEWGRILQYRQNYENGDKNYSISSVKEGLEYLKNILS